MGITRTPIYAGDSITLTGWMGGDPNRFSTPVSVTIDDGSWASRNQIQVNGTIGSIVPTHPINSSAGALEWSPDGTNWFLAGNILPGSTLISVGGIIPLASATQTMFFRLDNNTDFILGTLTPVTYNDINIDIVVAPPINPIFFELTWGVDGDIQEILISTWASFAQVIG